MPCPLSNIAYHLETVFTDSLILELLLPVWIIKYNVISALPKETLLDICLLEKIILVCEFQSVDYGVSDLGVCEQVSLL